MMPTEKRWNEVIIRQVFSDELADKIMSMLLITYVHSDRLIWKVEKHGKYSVKSLSLVCRGTH
jgi:hypothetical protein